MNPLILNKERLTNSGKGERLGAEKALDPDWIAGIDQRCKAAQDYLSMNKNESALTLDDLRTLVYEDVPALVRQLERLR